MLERMPAELLFEWMAFDRLAPIGGLRQDVGFAMICCQIANIFHRQGQSRPELTDFMPFLQTEPHKQTKEEQYQIFSQFAAAHNEFIRQGGG